MPWSSWHTIPGTTAQARAKYSDVSLNHMYSSSSPVPTAMFSGTTVMWHAEIHSKHFNEDTYTDKTKVSRDRFDPAMDLAAQAMVTMLGTGQEGQVIVKTGGMSGLPAGLHVMGRVHSNGDVSIVHLQPMPSVPSDTNSYWNS